ncbi:MAG: hypothetical protein ACREMH_00270 [Gemmatimonadales bacterium]
MTPAGRGLPAGAAVAAVVLLAWATPALAQGRDHLHDKLQVAGSGSLLLFNTDIRVDAANGDAGTEIDLEDLGLGDNGSFGRFSLRWRPWRRQEFEVGWQFNRREDTIVLEEDVTFGDTTFNVGAEIKPRFYSDALTLTWRWAIHDGERFQVGPTVGLGALFLEPGIKVRVSAGGSETEERDFSTDLVGPIGTIGAYARGRIGEEWFWEADVRGIYIPIDRFKAYEYDGGAAVRWFPFEKFGFEGGWAITGVRVDVEATAPEDRAIGRLRYNYTSFRLGGIWTP